MKWFLNISTRNKLFAGFTLMIAFIMIIMAVAYKAFTVIHETQEVMINLEFPVTLQLAKLRSMLNREREFMSRMVLSGKDADRKQWHDDIKQAGREYDEGMQSLLKLVRDNALYAPLAKDLVGRTGEYRNLWDEQIVPDLLRGKTRDAHAAFLGRHLELYDQLREVFVKFSGVSEMRDRELRNESEKIMTNTLRLFLVIGVVALLAGLALAIFITGVIGTPLRQASSIAEKIAYGDLTVPIPPADRKDEIGSLFFALGMMIESLRVVTREIKSSVEVIGAEAGPEDLQALAAKLKKLVSQYKV
ncbi:MAG: methyl-accepting chemotaxis protein [Nitrospirota bacterium]|nr:methyl-accepting chemotaxis protein [Nitrospirota bacterium]